MDGAGRPTDIAVEDLGRPAVRIRRPVGQDDPEVPQSLRGPTPAPSQVLLLADGDLDVDRIELGDRGERGAGLDQIADVRVLDARDTGDRGEDLRPAGVEPGIARRGTLPADVGLGPR